MDITLFKDLETVSLLDNSQDLIIENLENSIRRAVQTPLGYLGTFTLENQGLNYIDSEIGSLVYELLAEPLNSDFIYQIQSAIYESISSSNLSVEISNINIQILDLSTINILVEIRDLLSDGEIKLININL